MVKKRCAYLLVLFIIISINFVLAVSIDPVEKDQPAELYQTCNNCTYCNITKVTNPNGTILLSNQEFTEDPATYYYYILNESNTSTLGTYKYCYDCGNIVQSSTGCIDFEVTTDGFATDLSKAWVNIILLIFFIILIFASHHEIKKTDFKKWNDSIIKKYETKNTVKMVLSALLYNIMKNSFVIYYLLGLPILLIIMDLAYSYNVASTITIITAFFYIYLIGILIVGLIFLSHVQEWAVYFMDLIKNMDWGVED